MAHLLREGMLKALVRQSPPNFPAHILPSFCADAQGHGSITDLRTIEVLGESVLHVIFMRMSLLFQKLLGAALP